MTLVLILLSTGFISLIAVLSALLLAWKVKQITSFIPALVALAAGTLLSSAFLHLLPEALHLLPAETAFAITLVSFIGFFLLEKIFHWRHCHDIDCAEHQFGYINLIGDAIHNFVDGLVIAAAFIVDPWLGLMTAFALALHEIPQEMGDFGVLLLSGFSTRKALIANFSVALSVILGGLAGFIFHNEFQSITPYLLPIAAGNFLYLSASDLIPEMRDDHHRSRSMVVFLLFLIGVCLIPVADYIMPAHSHEALHHGQEELHEHESSQQEIHENSSDFIELHLE